MPKWKCNVQRFCLAELHFVLRRDTFHPQTCKSTLPASLIPCLHLSPVTLTPIHEQLPSSCNSTNRQIYCALHIFYPCLQETDFSVLPTPFSSAPSAPQSPTHLPFCSEILLLISHTHTHKYTSFSSVQPDQPPQYFSYVRAQSLMQMSHHLIIFSACRTRSNLERGPKVARGNALPPEGRRTVVLLLPLPPTDPPSSFPAKTHITKFNYSANMSHMLCGRQGRL